MIEGDRWLGSVLGCPAFRVSMAPDGSGQSILLSPQDLCESAQSGNAFFYAKVPTTRLDQARLLNAAGFVIADVNVTFEREPAMLPAETVNQPATIREAAPGDFQAALDIAATCFVYSRFHLDPLISKPRANAVKRAWIDSYCQRRRGECLVVAELDGRVVGFNAIQTVTANGGTVRIIDLIGVHTSSQGRGVGRQLVNHFVHSSTGRAARVRVGTQAANIPSMRLYEACGFRVVGTTYVLHAHVRGGEVAQ